MGCTGLRAAKIALIVINVLNIIGAIIVIVAAAAFGSQAQPDPDVKEAYSIAVGVLIFVSVCQIILSAIGIWGAAKEQLCMLYTYIGIVAACLIIFVVLFIIGMATSSNAGKGQPGSNGTSIFSIVVQVVGLCLASHVAREVRKNNSSSPGLA